MAASTHLGPLVVIGVGSPAVGEVNPTRGPSVFRHGVGLYDGRFGVQGGDVSLKNYLAWFGTDRVPVINQVPSTIADNNIVASAVQTTGVAMTLVAASGAGITVGVTVTNASTLAASTGNLAIDGAMGTLFIGDNPTVSMWDPAKAIARNVRITSAGDDSAGTFLVRGFDIYGFPMSELITGANAGIAAGKKAFKYITSITPGGVISGGASKVGTGDVYGFPLRSAYFANLSVFWNVIMITANTGFVAADATSPATTTTGDVRGTYAVQSASDAAKRLQVYVTPEPSLLTDLGLFGVAQV